MNTLARRSLPGFLLAVLTACTGSAAAPPRSSPATTQSVVAVVTAYYRAIVAGDYLKAFGYLAPGATGPDGQGLTQQTFLQLAHSLDGMGGPVTRFSVGALPSGAVMTLSRVRYGPYHAHLRMARTRNGWAISSIDRI